MAVMSVLAAGASTSASFGAAIVIATFLGVLLVLVVDTVDTLRGRR
jgi:hypothetical protein